MPNVTPNTPNVANYRLFELRLMPVQRTVADDCP